MKLTGATCVEITVAAGAWLEPGECTERLFNIGYLPRYSDVSMIVRGRLIEVENELYLVVEDCKPQQMRLDLKQPVVEAKLKSQIGWKVYEELRGKIGQICTIEAKCELKLNGKAKPRLQRLVAIRFVEMVASDQGVAKVVNK